LPAARIPVRDRPIFYVDELVPNAPKHAIALTVDDGPDPDYTPKVLRLLDKYRMQASFCVVGVHAEAYPRLIRDIAHAGHVIVNHTYTHVEPFNRQTERRIVDEITRTQRAIERAAKITPHLFRAPGGEWNHFIFRAVAAYDLLPLDWDVDPADWARPGTRRIERRMLRARPNDIVLCHDGGGNRAETVRALRRVLPTWKRRGYVTVPLVPPKGILAPPPSSSPSPSGPPTSAPPSATPTPTASSSPPSPSP
jgi:peptidoglycan/xylan/chitin deacetylase (PgdA/CDA1 family)